MKNPGNKISETLKLRAVPPLVLQLFFPVHEHLQNFTLRPAYNYPFEEQSCLILDSISNSVFMIQILDSIFRFHILGLPIFLWIDWNEHGCIELNKYNNKKINKIRTKLTSKNC